MAATTRAHSSKASKQQLDDGSNGNSLQQHIATFETEENKPFAGPSGILGIVANGSNRAADAAAAAARSTCRCRLNYDSYSHPLELDSHKVFRVLVIAPLIVWWVAIVAGMWVYEVLPKGQKVYHVMHWFDRGVLRPAGALVPLAVLFIRAAIHAVDSLQQQGSSWAKARRSEVKLGTLVLPCLGIYAVTAVARAAVYLSHVALLSNRYLAYHVLSDHIFLAVAMLASLHAEIICILSDISRCVKTAAAPRGLASDQVSWRELALTALFMVALFLYLFTAADMFYTAKYYHFPLESFLTTVVAFFMFQLPMVWWLTRMRRVQ
eukprot:GHRR01003477.1.p1 GENE.GHRR01003477.1~~GHRR01003477.1.p1  ORF type:complete len:322 (+),score=96.24 GHRR01003477.1:1150-2115(+)